MATTVHCCGFECGTLQDASASSTAHVGTRTGSGTMDFSTALARSGGRALRASTFGSNIRAPLQCPFLTAGARHVGRIYIYFSVLPSADTRLVAWGTATVGPSVFFKQSDSKIYAAVDTTPGASGVAVTTATWYRIDYDFNVATAGSDTCDVQVNGTACGQASGTGSSATASADSVGLVDTCSGEVLFDDYLLSYTAADYPLGAGYVTHFVPVADGTHNIAGTGDFKRGSAGADILNSTTDAYLLVDDVPLPSGTGGDDSIGAIAPANPTTDYVELLMGAAPDGATPTALPRGYTLIWAAHQAATQTGQCSLAIHNASGTIVDSTTTGSIAGSTTVRYYGQHRDSVNFGTHYPTLAAWTGMRARFIASDPAPDQFLDAVMVEAEFAGDLVSDVLAAQYRQTFQGVFSRLFSRVN